MKHEQAIRIVILAGSVRPGNYTLQAVRLLQAELESLNVEVTVIDPAQTTLPLPGQQGADATTTAMQDAVREATAVIVATPEYHGSMSSVIKLMIENLGFPSVLNCKPVGLLGVAAGAIGAIKSLEMLRSVLSHIGALVLPGVVSIANVNKVFVDGACQDEVVRKRINGLAQSVVDYIHDSVCPKRTLEEMMRRGNS